MLWWGLVFACRVDLEPLVEARGGGAGFWPPHSATAVQGAIDNAFPGLEVDVTPLFGGGWILQGGVEWQDCIDQRTELAPDPPAAAKWTLDDARGHLRCGGTPDPARPSALVVAEPPLSLVELVQSLRAGDAPDMVVHLHLRFDGEDRDLLRSALDTWLAADLPNPLRISVDDLDALRLLEGERRGANLDAVTILRVVDEGSDQPATVTSERWDEIVETGGGGVGMPIGEWRVSRRRAARRRGLEVVALDAHDADQWPTGARSVLTDFPADRP